MATSSIIKEIIINDKKTGKSLVQAMEQAKKHADKHNKNNIM